MKLHGFVNRPVDPNAPPLTLSVLEENLSGLWDDVGCSSSIMVSPQTKNWIRRYIRRFDGVRVKGCRGTVTVRFRSDRYEVVL